MTELELLRIALTRAVGEGHVYESKWEDGTSSLGVDTANGGYDYYEFDATGKLIYSALDD